MSTADTTAPRKHKLAVVEPEVCACGRWFLVTPFHCRECGRWKPSNAVVCEVCSPLVPAAALKPPGLDEMWAAYWAMVERERAHRPRRSAG